MSLSIGQDNETKDTTIVTTNFGITLTDGTAIRFAIGLMKG
jgi:hypothetical protein